MGTDYHEWTGRTQVGRDMITSAAVARLHATLDCDARDWPSISTPPLAHWLAFLVDVPQSALGLDGHPQGGTFLPPCVGRRMWAGGRVRFMGQLPLNVSLERTSRILSVLAKMGSTGPLLFVTISHLISANGEILVEEEQDLVFRDLHVIENSGPARIAPMAVDAGFRVTPDETMLFRFSALTFNAHRIHYDRSYARFEGYPDLVVQGPLVATLLIHHFGRQVPAAPVRRFSYRAHSPAFAGQPIDLRLSSTKCGAILEAVDGQGWLIMRAEVEAG